MRPALLASLVLAATAAPARAGVALPVAVRSADGGFEARFPSTPDGTLRETAGRRLHVLAARGEAGTSYTLVWSDHVREAMRAREAVCRAELVSLLPPRAAVLRDEGAALAGLDGRMVEAVLPGGAELRGRAAMRGARMFALVVTGPAASVDRTAEAFFLAFALAGEGVADPPVLAAARRVRLPEAGVSFELDGAPEREPGEVPHGLRALHVLGRGGLRMQRVFYVPAPVVPVGRDELLLGAVASALERTGARIRERRELTWRGRAAREVRMGAPHEDLWLRTVVLDDGALTLVVSGVAGTLTRAEAAAFFETLVVEGGAGPGS